VLKKRSCFEKNIYLFLKSQGLTKQALENPVLENSWFEKGMCLKKGLGCEKRWQGCGGLFTGALVGCVLFFDME
jgi:hypothetical protein